MLDRENNDFLALFIDRVVNDVRIFSGDQLAHARNGLCSADLWNRTRFWSEWRIAARTFRAAAGLRAWIYSAMAAISCAARGVNRSFIDRSDETRLRPRHPLRTGGASPAQDLPEQRTDAPDRS